MAIPAKRLLFLSVAAALASHSSTSSAASFHVSSIQELRTAIASANGNGEDDTIHLSARVYEFSDVDNIADGANALPSVKSDSGHRVSIKGVGAVLARAATAPAMRFFRVEEGARLNLADLEISAGRAAGDSLTATWGGAVLNYGIVETATCTFSGNQAYTNGGAVYNGGTARFHQTSFLSNGADLGGAIFNAGNLWVEESVVSANNARQDGGAGYNEKGHAEWSNTRLVNNTAGRDGGALLAQSGTTVMFHACHVSSNRADGDQDGIGNGGGICALAESFSETESIVSDNSQQDIAYTAAPRKESEQTTMVAIAPDGTVPAEFLNESSAPDTPSLELPSTNPGEFTPVDSHIEAPKFGDLAMSSGG